MTDDLPHENRVVLLVDSDRRYCEQLRRLLERQPEQAGAPHSGGVKVVVAEGLQAARQTLKTLVPQIVIANLQLPDGDGLELLTRDARPPYPVLITSDAHGERPAVRAMKAGAIDYVVKSAATVAALPKAVESALYEWNILAEHQRVQAEVEEIPQREQQRLGRELHDGLGQELTGLGLLARSLAKRLTGASSREQEMAEQLATGLEQALAEVRILARGLIPVQTDALGLVSALEELAARISEQSGITIELRHENPILISDNETATHVYRIVQEAITNSIKHAQANRIVLILEADEHQAVIEVRDDGRGLPDDACKKAGLGLRTMFHRCQLFGGSLDIYTHEEGGTRVRCCFPLNPRKQAF
jgi:signal transduction histidine kinase